MKSALVVEKSIAKPQSMTYPEQLIAGERAARIVIANIKSGIATPGDLALFVASLRGPAFMGACRLIEKTLGGRHA